MDKRKETKEQIWVDKQFKDLLEKLQAKKILAGENCKSVSEITKDIANNQKIKEIINKELAFGIKIIKEDKDVKLF